MNAKFLFVLLCAMVYTRDLGTISESNEFCNTCIDANDGRYWCTHHTYTTNGVCCDNGESLLDCVGSNNTSTVKCSNDTHPERGEYLFCPRETTQCQNTDDFYITANTQISRIVTGNVSQGRTCEYVITLYDPATGSSNNTNTYDITVDVEFVDSDTYLGVYKYTINTINTELIQEVGAGFTGAIQTTVDISSKVYVQMYPNSTSSSAIFNISSAIVVNTSGNNTTTTSGNSTITSGNTITTSSTTTDSGISGGAIAGVSLVVIILFLIIGCCFVFRRSLYKLCCKRTRMSNNDQPYPTSGANQAQMPMNNENVIYTGSYNVPTKQQEGTNLQISRDDEGIYEFPKPNVAILQNHRERRSNHEISRRNKSSTQRYAVINDLTHKDEVENKSNRL